MDFSPSSSGVNDRRGRETGVAEPWNFRQAVSRTQIAHWPRREEASAEIEADNNASVF